MMAQATEAKQRAALQQPQPLRLSRVFHARRETVFKAWSSGDHVRRWFSPDTFSVPDAKVEMHVGGRFDVCMRSPAGEEHWIRGAFVEVTPHTRLVIDMRVTDSTGKALFGALTEVDFPDVLGGTRMDVVQTYTLIDPAMAWMVAGAPEGWRTTLDKLDKEVVRMQGGAETGARSVVHATFHLQRTYDAPVARVWRALTDEVAKQKWFAGPPAAGNCSSGTWMCASAEANGSGVVGKAAWFRPLTPSITTLFPTNAWSTATQCTSMRRKYRCRCRPCS
jgi:uncharacterized protein YndB with AHSA1/START domain